MNMPLPLRRALDSLGSAEVARAFTITALLTVFGEFAIEQLVGQVTYITIIIGLCTLAIGILLARREEWSIVQLGPTTLALFLGWTLASTWWSANGGRSLASWLSLAALTLIAVTIGQIRDTLQTARALGDALRLLLGASLAVEVLSGILIDVPLAVLQVEGNIAELGPIQGVFGTRNVLGFVAVIALITFLVEQSTQSVPRGLSIYSLILAGLLGLFSRSPTVAVVAPAVIVAWGVLHLVRGTASERRSRVQWMLGATVLASVYIVYLARRPIIALMNFGSDVATRLTLWNAIGDFVRFDPVKGQGWMGPWDTQLWPFNALTSRLRVEHATGLNAYMDVLLQVGWIGLFLFLALCMMALVRSWLDASERRSIVYAWTPLVLVALLSVSVFESFALYGFGWMLLVLCAVRAGRSRSWRERMDLDPRSPDFGIS